MRSRAPLVRILVVVALVGGCGTGTTDRISTAPPPIDQEAPVRTPGSGPDTPRLSCDGRGDPDQPGFPAQDRPGTTEPSTLPAAMDTRHGVIVALETVAFPGETSVTWTFDVCTNTWHRMSPPVGPEGGMYRFVYHEAADVTLAVPHWTGPMWAYSVANDAWRRIPEPAAHPSGITDVAYDPDRAKVMAWSDFDGALYQYDLADNRWDQVKPLPYSSSRFATGPSRRGFYGGTLWYSLLAYDSVAHDLVLAMLPVSGVPGATWLFHSETWSWTRAEEDPPFLNLGYGEFGGEAVFDSAHGAVVIDALGHLATYTAADGTWSLPDPTAWAPDLRLEASALDLPINGQRVHLHLTRGPLARSWPTLVYDPINERIVMLGGTSTIVDSSIPLEDQWMSWILADVWTYDLSSNRWVQALSPHVPPVMSGHYSE